jgi:hypothetical protein
MTQEEKQIELAKFAGWTLRWQNKGGGELFNEKPKGHSWRVWTPPKEHKNDYDEPLPPNYFNDLNAVHELEKVLTNEQWVIYRDNIRLIVLGPIRMVSQWVKADIHASAAQKCEALGKTLNLW